MTKICMFEELPYNSKRKLEIAQRLKRSLSMWVEIRHRTYWHDFYSMEVFGAETDCKTRIHVKD